MALDGGLFWSLGQLRQPGPLPIVLSPPDSVQFWSVLARYSTSFERFQSPVISADAPFYDGHMGAFLVTVGYMFDVRFE